MVEARLRRASHLDEQGRACPSRAGAATGRSFPCGGDSGGPIFYEDNGGEIQVAVTSSGDAICRGSAIMARTDRPEVQEFLGCAIGSSLEEVADCGCTAVDSQGECP